MRRSGMFIVRKQSRNEGNNRAIALFEIFKNTLSCEVQHQLANILFHLKYHQLVAALSQSIDIRDSIHDDAHIMLHSGPD